MRVKSFPEHKSSIGHADANIFAVAAYMALIVSRFIPVLKLVSFVLPLVLFLAERDSYLVKFCALQAALFGFLVSVVNVIGSAVFAGSNFVAHLMSFSDLLGTGVLGSAGALVLLILNLVAFLVMILCLANASNYNALYLPVLGNLTSGLMEKLGKGDANRQ